MILIIDDDAGVRSSLTFLLKHAGFQAEAVSGPKEAIAHLRERTPELVLMDMNFTLGMNTGQEGLTWLRTLRHLHPQLPVVLITAYADVQLAVKCLKAGASDFVTKPWDNDELLRTLKDAVDKGQEIQSLDELERNHVKRVVDHCHGNISRAAELLGITRQTLYAKLHRP